ncbi:hypothetical protein B8A33_05180 [Dolosigranulum pigrum]|uniref:hypothetical protein n=1 Tax=Dolosigranulum pigrum TaxID=29394 RepID=UPI000DC01C3B|nr:hypothetical protein [Dolosigranulum pigrum]RAN56432.1 hypothetical protein B8A33_05180 [Dolosigranulum pigrum]
MLNKLSHVFFNSSIIIPYILAIGVSSLMSKESIVGLICLLISIILAISQIIFIKYLRNNLQVFKVNVTNVDDERNNWYIARFLSYFSPFIKNLLRKEIDNYSWILMVIAAILLILGNKTTNNLILRMVGYNSYKISTEQGKDFTLLSKRNIRKSNDVRKVIRIFEDILMEVEY